jgi:phosphoribosyl-AMP cyclohydrolase / phosphoribosyl-ATP pyrophosphohydrolase
MNLDFNKLNGLIPAIIQDAISGTVLMLGFMNEEAYQKTVSEGKVTFFSRSKNRLWTKGETSGNELIVDSILSDCDNDTLLIRVKATGPVCHTGDLTCFGDTYTNGFVHHLGEVISQRIDENIEGSYTNSLYKRGTAKIAQKVGEEAVELVIEAMKNDDELFKGEAADLLYHLLILLKNRNMTLNDIEAVLQERHK